MKKAVKIFLILVVFLLVGFFLGPRPNFPSFDAQINPCTIAISNLESHIAQQEQQVQKLRPDNEARILWADSTHQKTDWSLVFLHGFSASPKEGDPIIWEIAQKYKMNALLPRLAGHGIGDTASFKNLTPKDLVESAKEALAIGKVLGKKVLVVGSSTGCTLAAYLLAQNPQYADAIVFYSPNIDIHDNKSQVAVMPWGLQLLRKFYQGNYRGIKFKTEEANQYWTTKYRLEGLVVLRDLLNKTMPESDFSQITQPFMLGYWYKNEAECDKIISIEAAVKMFDALGTPQELKQKTAFKTVNAHVLTSKFQTENLDEVRKTTFEFLDKIVGKNVEKEF